MTDFDAITRGLAANLTAVRLPDGTPYQVSPFLLTNPKPPVLQVAAPEIDYGTTFGGDSDDLTFIVEAAIPAVPDITAQRILFALLSSSAPQSLRAAIEADKLLTSRVGDDGTVASTGEDAACDDLRVVKFRGSVLHTLEKGTTVRLASWSIQVLT